MKLFVATLLTALFSLHIIDLRAQGGPRFPTEDQLKAKEDYAKYEPLVKQTADWLEANAPNTMPEIWQQSGAFILRWLMGSPTVSMTIDNYLGKMAEDNIKLLTVYMARYASYSIDHPGAQSNVPAIKAALEAVAGVYRKGAGVKKTKDLDKLVTAVDKGKLDALIEKEFKTK